MKAEHNTITNSRQRKGTERIKSRCEKTIAKTKTYRNEKPKYVNPNIRYGNVTGTNSLEVNL